MNPKEFENDVVPYNLSKVLKELGYKVNTVFYWFPDFYSKLGTKFYLEYGNSYIGRDQISLCNQVNNGVYTNTISAPFYQDIINWFRIEHNMHGSILPIYSLSQYNIDKIGIIGYKGHLFTFQFGEVNIEYKTYEEAQIGLIHQIINTYLEIKKYEKNSNHNISM